MIAYEFFLKFVKTINPIQVLVIITFITALFKINFNKTDQRIVFFILLTSFLTEIICVVLNLSNKNITNIYNISFIITNSLWIFLILRIFYFKNWIYILSFYLIFCFLNLLLFEKNQLNYLTFILGSILYLIIFIVGIKKILQNEKSLHLKKNDLVIICAPIFIFIGLSLIFSLRSNSLINAVLLYDIYLYDFIVYIINILFFILVMSYLIKIDKKNV